MSTKHTPGRITLSEDVRPELNNQSQILESEKGDLIVYYQFRNKADARRLQACWNALEDLSQDALDGGWTRAGLEAYGLEMKAQRDELLEALQAIISADDAQRLTQRLIERGRAAIAKATGSAT